MVKSTQSKKTSKTATKTASKKRTSKKSTKKVEEVVTPVAEVTAPVVEVTAPVVEVSSTTPVVAYSPPAVEASASTETTPSVEKTEDKLVNLILTISTVQTQLKTLLQEAKSFQRQYKKELKELQKAASKSKRGGKSGKPRAPSGFAKPTKLSVSLCSFLGEEPGTELARTEVTKRLIKYIKEHDLQNPEAKKEIFCDDSLKSLLNPGDLTVTFFNLQTFMKHHFESSKNKLPPLEVVEQTA